MTHPIPMAPAAVLPTSRPESLPTMGHIGRYALKYRIGEGGLGTVYAAHDPLLSRLIAVKTLNVDLPVDQRDAFNAMFLNEAKAAGSLSHPNIVTVFDAGVHQDGASQSAYIAMELLKGKDLRVLMKEGWHPTPAQAGLIVRRVADALAFAHSKGVIHCDIKPANIFMVGRTQPRVLDFGIARIAKRRDTAANKDGDTMQHEDAEMMAGSPYYMAPEQVRPQNFERRVLNVDRRADVYALGVVFYELLTGHRPFEGETLAAITDAVLTRKPPTAHQLNPRVPKELSDIAERAMMRNRDHRTHSARAMSRELRAWLETQSPSAFEARPLTENKTRRSVYVAAGSVATVLCGGLLWWGLSGRAPQEAEIAAPTAALASDATLASDSAPASNAVLAPPSPPSSEFALPDPTAPDPERVNAAEPVAPTWSPEPIATYEVAASASSGIIGVTPVDPTHSSAAATPDAPPRAPVQATPRRAIQTTAPERAAPAPVAEPAPKRSVRAQAAAPVKNGALMLAVRPWAHIEVDGRSVGTTPPMNQLALPQGRHTIVLRNDAFPAYSRTINIVAGEAVLIKYRFGQ